MAGDEEKSPKLSEAVEAVKYVLENLWSLGVLFAVLGGFAVLATQHNIKLNDMVTNWAPSCLLFGVALILVSAITWFVDQCKRGVSALSKIAEAEKKKQKKNRNAIANLQTLNDGELNTLFCILSCDVDRFEIVIYSSRYPLLKKGILERLSNVDIQSSICEVNEGVLGIREQLLKDYEVAIRQSPGRFPEAAQLLYGQGRASLT